MRRRAVGLLVVGAGRRIIAGGIGITAMSPVLDLIADGRRRQRCLPHLSRFLFVWSMQKPDHVTWFKVPAECAHVYHKHVHSCPERKPQIAASARGAVETSRRLLCTAAGRANFEEISIS
jgi:hypothetical protein